MMLRHKLGHGLLMIPRFFGKIAALSSLAMTLIITFIVTERYFFSKGSIALQESVQYLYGFMILAGIPHTFQLKGHVKIDLFYQHYSIKLKRICFLCMHLFFLIPSALALIYYCWEYVIAAIRIKEASHEAGGLPYLYILKTTLLLLPCLLLIESLGELLTMDENSSC